MLYPKLTAQMPAPKPPMHYFDSAELLLRLQAQGHSRAELSRITGLTIPQLTDRMRLSDLDDGLRAYLRREGVPEKIAIYLLRLPDPVTRRRLAHRIVKERLCIRDAGLLIASARRSVPRHEEVSEHQQHVITLIRDVRPYRNAIRDIVEQMKTAGVRVNLTERRLDGMQELTIVYPTRRRRTERYQAK